MRISRLELDGIGPFDHAVFEIPEPEAGCTGELVLFEGPNGCGKTTIAETLAVAACPTVYALQGREKLQLPRWAERFRRKSGRAVATLVHAGIAVSQRMNDKQIEWPSQSPGGLVKKISDLARRIRVADGFADTFGPYEPPFALHDWNTYTFQGHQETPALDTAGPQQIDPTSLRNGNLAFGTASTASLLGQLLTNIDYTRVRSAQHAQEAASPEDRKALQEAASSLRTVIERMQHAFSEVLDRRVEFRFEIQELSPRILFDGDEIPLHLLGEGMRATVAWLADLLIRLEAPLLDHKSTINPFNQEFWLVLDEVEVNLHPQLQARLFPTLRKLFPNARIYATTHSPFAVAAAGDGIVFSIRPDRKTHHVNGIQKATRLAHGQSLSWVVEEVFDTSSTFLDEKTRQRLDAHKAAIKSLRANQEIQWDQFLTDRRWLMELNEEVNTIVAMREVPVQRLIERKLQELRP